MKKAKPKAPTSKIVLPGRSHPFLLALLALSLGVAATAGSLFYTNTLPVPFMPVLVAMILASLAVAKNCYAQLQETTLTLHANTLEISSPTGHKHFHYSDIEALRLVGPYGHFGDNPLIGNEKRIGIALFLKNGRDGRMEANEADFFICSGDQQDGDTFMKAIQHVQKAMKVRKRQTHPAPAPRARRRPISSRGAVPSAA